MGRPPLNHTRTHLHLPQEDLDRIDAIVGDKGRSKFIRDAIRAKLDQIAPADEEPGPPYFEYDGGHEPRLSPSGRATVLAMIKKRAITLDQLQERLSFEDPVEFLHALLGYRTLPNRAVSVLIAQLLPRG